jgi:hypothetical protein
MSKCFHPPRCECEGGAGDQIASPRCFIRLLSRLLRDGFAYYCRKRVIPELAVPP